MEILDENDNAPFFHPDHYEISIEENIDTEKFVLEVYADDFDAGQNGTISYSIDRKSAVFKKKNNKSELFISNYNFKTNKILPFKIDPNTGKIYASENLDRELIEEYEFLVIAEDKGPIRLNTKAIVKVNILNTNDCKPEFQNKLYLFEVTENAKIESILGKVDATDLDGPTIRYTITDSYNETKFTVMNFGPKEMGDPISDTLKSDLSKKVPFAVHPLTGVITVKNQIDREEKAIYYLNLIATDSDEAQALTGTASLTIIVKDENDNFPKWVFPNGMHF